MSKRRMKYNPSFLTEEELIESFVVRHADLDIVVGIIGENVTDSNQHVLVIGPRGIGKTTMVHRVAAEIEQNAELRDHWYPLIFSEESYEVVSAGEFWLEALFHLSEQADDEKWRRTYAELKNESDDQRLAERALAQLLDFADSQGKRILMIVENLNMLLGDLNSDDEAWKIRHTLLNEPRLMLLATATNRFEHVENSSQAMFEMFKMQELKPLEDDECNQIWEQITGEKLLGERIKPIRILTGGNPRLLTIIAKFSAHRSFRKLLDDLVDLIDDHTEYFKSHLDNLPAIERKVYLALAGLWDASTAREIAQAARLDVNKTSSLLSRLINRGAVVAEEHGKKTKWYVVAERMYNIYYLMRRRGKPADRVKATVKFLVSMYDPESAARLISEEACGLSPELRRDHCLAYEAAINEVPDRQLFERIIAAIPRDFLESPYFSETEKNFMSSVNGLATKEVFSNQIDMELNEAKELISQGLKHCNEGEYEQSISCLGKVIEKFGCTNNPTLLCEVAMTMVLMAATFTQLNRTEEAITVCNEVMARFEDTIDGALLEQVASAMTLKAAALTKLNRSEEAITVCNEVMAHFADVKEAELREHVAKAMILKAVALDQLNYFDEAIVAYDEVVASFADTLEGELREQVAWALILKASAHDKLNHSEEEIAAYNEVIARFSDTKDSELCEQVAQAMTLKAVALTKLHRFDDAIIACDKAVASFADTNKSELREKVAWALILKAAALSQLKRIEEAIVVYDEVVARFTDAHEAVLRGRVAKAMFSKGYRLGQLNRFEEEITVYDEVVSRFADAKELTLREQVARAMCNKGYAFGQLNRSEDAIAAYDEVVACFADAKEVTLREQVANAMLNKAITLAQLNRFEEAIAVYSGVTERYADTNENEALLREKMASAFYNKGDLLNSLDRFKEAEMVYRKAIELAPDAAFVTVVTTDLIDLLLKMPGRIDDARQIAEEIINKNQEDSMLLNSVAWAFYKYNDKVTLPKAVQWATNAIALAPDNTYAHHTLACILSALGKSTEALESAKRYIQDTAAVEKTIEDAIELFVELAASGFGKEALRILANSEAEKHLEPLIVGLKLYIGEDVKTAPEIREIAKDVVKRIEERKKLRGVLLN